MNTLASILAGQGGNPYQTTQGIAPLLSQFLLNQQMAQGQLGGQSTNAMAGAGQSLGGMAGAGQQGQPGIGSMGSAAGLNPQALLQAVAMQNQGSQ